jgi:hypothetical protein
MRIIFRIETQYIKIGNYQTGKLKEIINNNRQVMSCDG